jgi:hypothetical protein
MSYETVVAVYDKETSASATLRSLRAAGYISDDTSVIRNEGEAQMELYGPGIWKCLFGSGVDPREAAVFSRCLKEGSVIISVRVPESEAPKVIRLLDGYRPVDVWDRAKLYGLAGTAARASGTSTLAKQPGDETLGSAEEQLNFGKSIVGSSRTRVLRYFVDKPVKATVTLHEEHADAIRRATPDPAYIKAIHPSARRLK